MTLKAVPLKDPRLELTAQDLVYAATCLRESAVQCEKTAMTRENPALREIPLDAAREYRELAAKYERTARGLSASMRPIGPGG